MSMFKSITTICRSSPLGISRPLCTGTVVLRPSGWVNRRWDPRDRISTKPSLRSTFIKTRAVTTGVELIVEQSSREFRRTSAATAAVRLPGTTRRPRRCSSWLRRAFYRRNDTLVASEPTPRKRRLHPAQSLPVDGSSPPCVSSSCFHRSQRRTVEQVPKAGERCRRETATARATHNRQVTRLSSGGGRIHYASPLGCKPCWADQVREKDPIRPLKFWDPTKTEEFLNGKKTGKGGSTHGP